VGASKHDPAYQSRHSTTSKPPAPSENDDVDVQVWLGAREQCRVTATRNTKNINRPAGIKLVDVQGRIGL
jgi:hypothetical protein